MTYQEMLDGLADLEEARRRAVIREHWQTVLSEGFVAFVQGQIDAARNMILPSGPFDKVFEGQSHEIKKIMKQQFFKAIARYSDVWDSMSTVYTELQQHSERQGNRGGMVDHGRHRTMPRGVHVAPASKCFRCGSPAVAGGLCQGCQATQDSWDAADAEYDRELVRRDYERIEYERLQDDNTFYSTQQDFYHDDY